MNDEIHISADATDVLNRLYFPRPGTRADSPLIVDSEKESGRFSACMSLMLNRIVSMQEIETMPRLWLVWPAMQPLDPLAGPIPARKGKKNPVTAVPESSAVPAERKESPAEAVQRRLGWMRIPRSKVRLIDLCSVGTIGMLWQTPEGFHFDSDGSHCPASARGSLKQAQLRDASVRFLWFSFDMFTTPEPAAEPGSVLAALAEELAGESLDHGVDPEDGSPE